MSRRAVRLTSDEVWEEKRWQQIFEDISNRPSLERAQAEAIITRAQSQTGATDERKRELRKRVEDRFGLSEPVRPPLLALVDQPTTGQQKLFGEEAAADAQPESQRSEGPKQQKAREKLSTKKKAAKKAAGKKRKAVEAPRVVQSTKGQFERLVLHMGVDAAQAALDDLRRRYGVA